MTNDQINIAMAKVMGWRIYGPGEHGPNPQYPHVDVLDRILTVSYDSLVSCFLYNPTENIIQAFEAAEKVGLFDDEDVYLCKKDGYWVTARFDLKGDIFYSESALTPALAICKVVLKGEEG